MQVLLRDVVFVDEQQKRQQQHGNPDTRGVSSHSHVPPAPPAESDSCSDSDSNTTDHTNNIENTENTHHRESPPPSSSGSSSSASSCIRIHPLTADLTPVACSSSSCSCPSSSSSASTSSYHSCCDVALPATATFESEPLAERLERLDALIATLHREVEAKLRVARDRASKVVDVLTEASEAASAADAPEAGGGASDGSRLAEPPPACVRASESFPSRGRSGSD